MTIHDDKKKHGIDVLDCGCVVNHDEAVVDVCPYHFDIIFAMRQGGSEK